MRPETRHYLDYNATAVLRPEARAAMQGALDNLGNPSSVHAEGRAAKAMLDRARRQVADLMGVGTTSVFFTSGATEANNWALSQVDGPCLIAATSHDSVFAYPGTEKIRVDSAGCIDLTALTERLDDGSVGLISVMAVNNETGVVQPLEDLSQLCRAKGIPLHIDGVQAPGKTKLPPVAVAGDLISISAHKLGGPSGIGALICTDPMPMLRGGGQEQRRRAGTENLLGIVGFGAAAEAVSRNAGSEMTRINALRTSLEAGLRAASDAIQIYGAGADRACNTVSVRMPGVTAETQVMALDLGGVAVSAGSACSSGKVTPSHVLQAMGIPRAEAAEAIRISLGWESTEDDVDACLTAWRHLWNRKRVA